jgi:nucleoside-diphosphate-sugar epimerase
VNDAPRRPPAARIFVAGASGVLGVRLVPLLVGAGHTVAAMTRTPAKVDELRRLGATPVVCDAFQRDALIDAMTTFGPDTVIDQLTDLPDDPALLAEGRAATARLRLEGTANVIAAYRAGGATRLVVQSIAWNPGGGTPQSITFLESAALDTGGVVLRYGQWWGPGTYFPDTPPAAPRVHIDTAARRTLDALGYASGTYVIVDDDDRA